MLLAVVAVFAAGCRKDNPNYEFIGEYHASEMKFDIRFDVFSQVVTLKDVTLDLKRSGKENVTGTFKFGSVRGNSYSVKGVCWDDNVVFDEFTVDLDDIKFTIDVEGFCTSFDINLELTLNCIGTLNGRVMNMEVYYSGFGSTTENGVTNHVDFDDGITNVSFTKQGNNNSNHEYVDLGLPSGTLWATCNVGANSPEEFGAYFAWGETSPKEEYLWTTYQHCVYDNSAHLTKYCNNAQYGYNGYTDNLVELEPEDDAATVNWGSNWRTPTRDEWIELFENTGNIWTLQNGVNGLLFSSSNGNSIFLPATFIYEEDGGLEGLFVKEGNYWSSSLDEESSYRANIFIFAMHNLNGIATDIRKIKGSVRPVRSSGK